MTTVRSRYSLVKKITRQNLTVLLVSMLLSFVLIAAVLWLTARDRQGSAAELAAVQLARNVSAMLVFNDPVEARRELTLLANQRALTAIALYDSQGKLFASVPGVAVAEFASDTLALTTERGYQGLQIKISTPVLVKDKVEGVLYLSESLHQLMNWFIQGLAVMSVLMLLIYLLAARLLVKLQKQALSPLVELAALAERVAAERNFSLRAPVVNNDEIGSLTQGFNELLKRAEIWQSELSVQLQQESERGAELEHLALYDSLTALPNRHYFGQLLHQMVSDSVQHGQKSALLFIDLDNFKYVNDNFGHDAGDAVLVEVSKRILAVIRADDHLCRLGGDEFALLLPKQVTVSQTSQLCERLLAQIRAPLLIKNTPMPVGLSIGVALCPEHSNDVATLLQLADEAMYRAKRAGKNGYQIYQAS